MEIIEEEVKYGAVGRVQHLRISRKDTILNDLRNSTMEGMVSFASEIFAVILFLGCLYGAFRSGGRSGYFIGAMLLLDLLIAIEGVIWGVLGLKNRKKIRHYMEIRGLVTGGILIALLIACYVRGVILFFS